VLIQHLARHVVVHPRAYDALGRASRFDAYRGARSTFSIEFLVAAIGHRLGRAMVTCVEAAPGEHLLVETEAYGPWVHLAGTEPRGFPWSMVNRVLSHYLLVTSFEGREEIVVGGIEMEIAERGSYLIQPGVVAQRIGSRGGNRPAYVHFDVIYNPRRNEHINALSNMGLEGREHLLQPQAPAVWGVDLPVRPPRLIASMVARSIETIIHRYTTAHPHERMMANHQLAGLLHAWVLHEASNDAHPDRLMDPEAWVRRAEAVAQNSLALPFGVEDFARAAGLSRVKFNALYQSLRLKTPGRALRDMRLDAAERLLLHTKLTVQDIGQQVGYPNPTVLARCFRERHACSPTEWRSRMLGSATSSGD
jgi:AraC-like DNA-binding protein